MLVASNNNIKMCYVQIANATAKSSSHAPQEQPLIAQMQEQIVTRDVANEIQA